MSSVVGDTSNPTPDGDTPRSTSRTHVDTESSAVGESPKRLKFNEFGAPIGDKAPCSSRIGKLARTHIPISYKTWKLVPKRYLNIVWDQFKIEYPEVMECQKEYFMGKANFAWKKFKSTLREKHFVGGDVSKWKEKVPPLVKSEDWELFCDHEGTDYQKQVRIKNKTNRLKSERKSTHNTGRHGYAQAAAEWEKKNGRPPTRAELWLATHKTKNGDYAPYNQKIAEKIEVLLKVFNEKGEKETLDSGPIYDVFGKDSRGHVRCVGSNISRTAMLNSSYAREMLSNIKLKEDGCEEKVDKLTTQVDRIDFLLTKFIDEFMNGKFVAPDGKSTTKTQEVETPLSGSRFGNEGVYCKINGFAGELVGHGWKTKSGDVIEVHGHILGPREVKVALDRIFVPNHRLWGGTQGGADTLEEIGSGGFMYWHEDLLHPF